MQLLTAIKTLDTGKIGDEIILFQEVGFNF